MARNGTTWTKGRGPSTKFQPGQSGNPAGRPKSGDLVSKARQYTDMALEGLVELASQREDLDIAKDAMCAILDRGWGRPAVAILAQINGHLAVGGIDRPPKESLEEWLARRRRELAALDGPPQEHAQSAPSPPNGETAAQGEPPQARVAERPGAAGSAADSAGPSMRSMTPEQARWLQEERKRLGIETDSSRPNPGLKR